MPLPLAVLGPLEELAQLGDLLNKLLENTDDEPVPYSFEILKDQTSISNAESNTQEDAPVAINRTLAEAFEKSQLSGERGLRM